MTDSSYTGAGGGKSVHPEPVVTLVEEGHPVTYRGKNRGAKRTVTVDREWVVELDGEEVGRIRYEMVTRETRSGQRTYVNNRWHSPGWRVKTPGYYRWFERYSKKDAIEYVVSQARRRAKEASGDR